MLPLLKKENKDDILDWLSLIRSENVGPRTFFDLIKIYGSAKDALFSIPELSKKGGSKKPIKIFARDDAEKELSAASKIGAEIINCYDNNYPELLKNIYDPPPVITILGKAEILNDKCFAVVGSRNASSNACIFASKIAEELGEAGVKIVSGLARGIDTAAHKGSLKTGTIAVVAGGIDNIYPPENKNLREKIIETGCVVAELPFGAMPKAQNFPQRNRIISGISLGTLIVEATLRSGSLITARLAGEQGRDVFAVPGFPLDPRCEGTNRLLKQGAIMVENATDILDAINQSRTEQNLFSDKTNDLFSPALIKLPSDSEIEKVRDKILAKLGSTATPINKLIEECETTAQVMLAAIIELELAGKVERLSGNKVSLVYNHD